jgi:hypothetical protein
VHGALPGVVRIWPRAEAIEEHREALMSQREVMEELVVYNAAEPGEKHVLSLTLRLAPPTALRGRYPITRDNYAFMALEMCVNALPGGDGALLAAVFRGGRWQRRRRRACRRALERISAVASAPLYVELCWLTDELIKFGSSKHVAYADVLSLAHVVFRFLFEREPLARFAKVAAQSTAAAGAQVARSAAVLSVVRDLFGRRQRVVCNIATIVGSLRTTIAAASNSASVNFSSFGCDFFDQSTINRVFFFFFIVAICTVPM